MKYTGEDIVRVIANDKDFQVKFNDGTEYYVPFYVISSGEWFFLNLSNIMSRVYEDKMRDIFAEHVNAGEAIGKPDIPY